MTREQIDALEGEKIIRLHRAIEHAGRTYSELELREPTAGQMVEIEKKRGWESNIHAVALCSGVPEAAVKMMSARDIDAAMEFIAAFFGADPAIGTNE